MKMIKEVRLEAEDITEAIRRYVDFTYKESVDSVKYDIITDPSTNRLVVASATAKIKT